MKLRLNRKGLVCLHDLIKSGQYVDKPWSFSAADSDALLGDGENWAEYARWFLGTDPTAKSETKAYWAYPFGKGDKVYLSALRDIASRATANGDVDIAEAASEALEGAEDKNADNKLASGEACDLDIAFTAPVDIQAAAGKTPPAFMMDAYTGGPMELDGWDYPVVVDYDGMNLTAKSRPILRDHNPEKPLGHSTKLYVEDGVFKAQGLISASGPHVDEVVASAKNKFPWQASIGAKVLKNQFVPEGQSARANGKSFDGPINIARKTLLREISFLSLGADDDTSATIAARAAGDSAMKFKAWMKARGLQCDGLDATSLKCARDLFRASVKDGSFDADDGADDDKKPTEAAAAELDIQAAAAATSANQIAAGMAAARNQATAESVLADINARALANVERLDAINAALDQYRDQIEPETFKEIRAKAFTGKLDQNGVELALIKAARPNPNTPNGAFGINTGRGGQADGTIIAAAAARSLGCSEKAAFAGLNEQQGNIAASLRIGASIHSIIAACAPQVGMHAAAGGIDRDFLDDYLRKDRESHRRQIQAAKASGVIFASVSSGFSTMSLTGITENIQNKMMLEAYALQATVGGDICFDRDTNDFKAFKVYRLTASGDFEQITSAGEIAAISLQDASYSNQVVNRGALLVLTYENILNDDMGALAQSSQILGRKASLNLEKLTIATFLSGLSTVAPGPSIGKAANAFNFWSAGAANYLSGGSSALGITSLTSAVTKFLQQVDDNGDPIGLMPDRLLVCPELKATAENLFNGANLTVSALATPASTSGSAAAQAASQTVNLNQHKGLYRPLVSPFLGGVSKVTGASATQWALLTNPTGGSATVQRGFLRGQRSPMIRQVDTDANVVGLAFQVLFPFGTALLDWRTGVYSAGQ